MSSKINKIASGSNQDPRGNEIKSYDSGWGEGQRPLKEEGAFVLRP